MMIFEQSCALLINFRIKFSALSLMGIHYARTVDINEVVEEFIRVHPRTLFDHNLFDLICWWTLA